MATKIPKIRFSRFDAAWEQCELGSLAEVTKLAGFEFTKYVNYSDNGTIIALRGLNIKEGLLDLKDVKYIDGSDLSKLARSKLFVDDIVFTYVGTVGEVALIPQNDRFYLAPNVARIRINKPLSSAFLACQLGSPFFYQRIIFPLIATSSQPALSMQNIRKFNLGLPQLEEQEKIASLFAQIGNVITLHQKKLKHFKNLKESLLQNMFPREGEIFPRLRFPEFTDAWEQRKLIDEVELFGGLTYSPKDVVPSPGSIVLRSSNVKGGEISLDDNVYVLKEKATSTPVQLNDIIVVVRNGSRSLIGKHAIVKAPLNNAVIGAFMTGFRTKQPDFINVLMDTHAFKKAITENLGATINQITGGMLKQMVFFMPASEKEKRAIGNLFRTLDDALALHQRKLAQLKKLKTCLFNNLFVN